MALIVNSGRDGGGSATSVPAHFQGEWAASPKQSGSAGDVHIGATEIRFQESRDAIKAVVTQADGELALISELSGEGDTWQFCCKNSRNYNG